MPSRLGLYRRLLESALEAGYEFVSVERFWHSIVSGAVDPMGRYVVLRHDVDTGVRTTAAIWRIEESLGIAGSYYFRLSHLDPALMGAIADAGGHASYHYEELATVAKRRHLRDREDVLRHLPEAQDDFRRNLTGLRTMTDLPMRVVAAHGDFVNRKCGVPNHVILADREFRREVDVDLETYDDEFMRVVTSRHADRWHPPYWRPSDPLAAIRRAEPVIYLLVHPSTWQIERRATARENLVRLREGLVYALPISPRRGTPSSPAPAQDQP